MPRLLVLRKGPYHVPFVMVSVEGLEALRVKDPVSGGKPSLVLVNLVLELHPTCEGEKFSFHTKADNNT